VLWIRIRIDFDPDPGGQNWLQKEKYVLRIRDLKPGIREREKIHPESGSRGKKYTGFWIRNTGSA